MQNNLKSLSDKIKDLETKLNKVNTEENSSLHISNADLSNLS
jgi:hypothetical protein